MAKKDPYDDYEVPHEHTTIMLTMCGLNANDPKTKLPEAVRKRYIECRIVHDRGNLSMTPAQLALVVCTAEKIVVKPKPPTKISELWADKQLKHGEQVLCTFRKQKNMIGTMQGITADGRVLIHMEDGEERKIPEEDVYLTPIAK